LKPTIFALWLAPVLASAGQAQSIFAGSTPSSYMRFTQPVELGVKFRSDVSGYITGVQFYKSSLTSGTHTGSLWASTGALLATGTYNETSSGWQMLQFSPPVAILPNTTYVASYHNDAGIVPTAFGYFSANGADNAPLHALKNGVDGPNGVYALGSGGQFPTTDGSGNNYWIDVLFSTSNSGSPPPPQPPAAVGTVYVRNSNQVLLPGAGLYPVLVPVVAFTLPQDGNYLLTAKAVISNPNVGPVVCNLVPDGTHASLDMAVTSGAPGAPYSTVSLTAVINQGRAGQGVTFACDFDGSGPGVYANSGVLTATLVPSVQ
jgi:hypothetical protein